LETGSERLAAIHMPNKTLPLRIGPHGEWQEIVLKGLVNLNRAYWRPAFTIQVGQTDETPEDSSGNPLKRAILATALSLGSWRLLGLIENICKRRGVDVEKVKRYGLEQRESIRVNAS